MMYLNITKIEQYASLLTKYLDRTDIVGYASARNNILFNEELNNFNQFKNDLLLQYGHEQVDSNGNGTGTWVLDNSDEKFEFATKEYNKVLNLDHDINIIKVKYKDIIGLLSGNEIIELSWMFED